MIQRLVVPLLLAIALLGGAWLLWNRASSESRRVDPPAAPAAPATPTPTPTPELAVVESEFRLAGIAVGPSMSWAAIEHPDGSSHLYRNGEEVADLGTIVSIHSDHVVILGEEGEFRLKLRPAPSPTPERRRRVNAAATSTPPSVAGGTPRG